MSRNSVFLQKIRLCFVVRILAKSSALFWISLFIKGFGQFCLRVHFWTKSSAIFWISLSIKGSVLEFAFEPIRFSSDLEFGFQQKVRFYFGFRFSTEGLALLEIRFSQKVRLCFGIRLWIKVRLFYGVRFWTMGSALFWNLVLSKISWFSAKCSALFWSSLFNKLGPALSFWVLFWTKCLALLWNSVFNKRFGFVLKFAFQKKRGEVRLSTKG